SAGGWRCCGVQEKWVGGGVLQRLVLRLAGPDFAALAERDAELLRHAPVSIREEREVELFHLLEEFMVRNRVAADADDLDALVNELVHVVPEFLRLDAAAAREVGRIEIDHQDALAGVIRRLPGLAFVVLSL